MLLLYVVYVMVVWPISQGLSKLNVHTKMVELSFYAYFLSKYFDFFIDLQVIPCIVYGI